MLRLRPFDLLQPLKLEEVLEALRTHAPNARLIAGGTDLLPNLKLGHGRAEVLVSLRQVAELNEITLDDQGLRIGAGVRLHDLAQDPDVLQRAPILAESAARAASPQIRRMGTLGGNLLLDTRCRYINQSELFREALGGCLKSHGQECHVVPGGQTCVSALSADTVPALIVLGATVEIAGPSGRRSLPVADLYVTDGTQHTAVGRDEVLMAVRVPASPVSDAQPGLAHRFATRKWAVRKSIDFPLVAIALRLDLDGEVTRGGVLAVAVLGPRPRVLDLAAFAGVPIDDALADRVGQLAFDRCRPLPNVPYDAAYRRERLAVEVRRAVRSLAAD
ncbi:MAG: FAD binding domain-containing protein [Myxococcota bacterium]